MNKYSYFSNLNFSNFDLLDLSLSANNGDSLICKSLLSLSFACYTVSQLFGDI